MGGTIDQNPPLPHTGLQNLTLWDIFEMLTCVALVTAAVCIFTMMMHLFVPRESKYNPSDPKILCQSFEGDLHDIITAVDGLARIAAMATLLAFLQFAVYFYQRSRSMHEKANAKRPEQRKPEESPQSIAIWNWVSSQWEEVTTAARKSCEGCKPRFARWNKEQEEWAEIRVDDEKNE